MEDAETHDRWFRAKVQRALVSGQPTLPHDQVMADAKALIESKRRAPSRLDD